MNLGQRALASLGLLALCRCNDKIEVFHSSGGPIPPPPPPLLLPVVCDSPLAPAGVEHATNVVGEGTPESCTEARLAAAVAVGESIVFRCGAAPATITVTSSLVVTADTVVDGAGLITLSGARQSRIFVVRGQGQPKLTLRNLTITDGHAPAGDGGIDEAGGAVLVQNAIVVVHNSIFRQNAADGARGYGGAIGGAGDCTLVGSRFEDNTAQTGGAIGLSGGTLTISNSRIEGNFATGSGEDGRGGGIAIVASQASASLCGSTVSGNTARVIGGGVYVGTMSGGTLAIDRSTIDGNQANDPDATPPKGTAGGIYAQGASVTVTSSTISNNQAVVLGGLWVGGFDPPNAGGSVDIVNVTVAKNRVYSRMPITDTGLGGGIWIDKNTTGHLTNATVVANEAQFAAGVVGVGALTIDNSIVANQTLNLYNPINCSNIPFDANASAAGADDLQWPADNQGGSDFLCAKGSTAADPMLDDLGDHGGPTLTIAPRANSPALARGSTCPATDQRGRPRKTPCTLGAYESE